MLFRTNTFVQNIYVTRMAWLQEEHLAIKRRKNLGETVNWHEYKYMKFTQNVLNPS